jgi:exodeoxyribonuclease VII large subunit
MLYLNEHNLPIFSVSELSSALKKTVEDQFSLVRVRGEISGFKRATSGHVYFTLKDQDAILDAVAWRGTALKFPFNPEDGLEVICRGKITTFPGRSKYQIIVDSMELAGEGALLALLEKRKQKLLAEGLFDPARKKPIPFLPLIIGVITSPTGSVIRDILHRIQDRFPSRVLVWPCLVQGEGAKDQIAAAINGFNQLSPASGLRPDLLIVARGGGSIEDLWAFNEEIVVRAAANSSIPLISAIGHETDTTLIDFASDLRAPTPSAAAEMAVPVRQELYEKLVHLQFRASHSARKKVQIHALNLTNITKHLKQVLSKFDEKNQKLDLYSEKLQHSVRLLMAEKTNTFQAISHKILHPKHKVQLMEQEAKNLFKTFKESYEKTITFKTNAFKQIAGFLKPSSIVNNIQKNHENLNLYQKAMTKNVSQLMKDKINITQQNAALLKTLSYENTLNRGFVIVENQDHKTITSVENIKQNDNVMLRFKDGKIKAKVQ